MSNITKNSRKSIGRGKPRLTKKAQLIGMLSAKAGADVAAISKKLGWQAHTTRAAITGLRKAGYQIGSEKGENGKGRCYRITAGREDVSCTERLPATATTREAAHAGQS